MSTNSLEPNLGSVELRLHPTICSVCGAGNVRCRITHLELPETKRGERQETGDERRGPFSGAPEHALGTSCESFVKALETPWKRLGNALDTP